MYPCPQQDRSLQLFHLYICNIFCAFRCKMVPNIGQLFLLLFLTLQGLHQKLILPADHKQSLFQKNPEFMPIFHIDVYFLKPQYIPVYLYNPIAFSSNIIQQLIFLIQLPLTKNMFSPHHILLELYKHLQNQL